MRIESLKENFYNLPFILAGKVSSFISRRITPLVRGYVPFPQVVSLYLTERCNLNCKMCFLKNIKTDPGFIPLSVVKSLVSELMCIRPRYSMSGGEPFLHPDIEELIKFIKSHSLSLSIVTNGTKLTHFAKLIVHTGVDRIKVSIDGVPDVHDKIRGVPGTFSNLCEGIEEINKEKKKQGKRKPRLFLYSLLHPSSDPEFIISFAEQHNFAVVNFLHILSIGPEDLREFACIPGMNPHYWKGAVFDNENFRITRDLFRRIRSIDSEVEIMFTPNIEVEDLERYYERDSEYLSGFKGNCTSPWTSVYIMPPSKAEICPDVVVGSIKNKRFLSVWNSNHARNLRNRIFSGNVLPVCKGCCSYYM